MCARFKKHPLKPIFLIGLAAVCTLSLNAYYDRIHKLIALRALELIRSLDSRGLYKEVYSGFPGPDRITEGAVREDYGAVDGNGRAMRHYYVKDAQNRPKGVKFYPWYHVWTVIDRTPVTEPAAGYYEGALEWAKTSGKTTDPNNWEGAIRAYGYTVSSRDAGYLRLGHVVHLLADMAEPDHAADVPHPGSGFELNGLYGYEHYIETVFQEADLRGDKIIRKASLDEYFNTLADLGKIEAQSMNLTIPLGLIYKPGYDALEQVSYLAKAVTEAPVIPTIDPAADGPQYLKLARTVMKSGVEYDAGLIMDFHDIVNTPPFVRSIEISGGVYMDNWKDHEGRRDGETDSGYDEVYTRELIRTEQTFDTRRELKIRIKIEDEVLEESLRIKIVRKDSGQTVVDERPRLVKDQEWELSFTPALEPTTPKAEYQIEIQAQDIHNHYPRAGLPAKNYWLDSDPETPAKANEKPPYGWTGYEPGPDTHYSFTVERGASEGWAGAVVCIVPDPDDATRGELAVADEPPPGSLIITPRYDTWAELYRALCPLIHGLSKKRFLYDSPELGAKIKVKVDKKYLEKCDILPVDQEGMWENAVEPQKQPGSESQPKSESVLPESVPRPEPPASPDLPPPTSMHDVPLLLSKMGFRLDKMESCAYGTCYWLRIADAAKAESYGFKSGALRLLGLDADGNEVFDGVAWGEWEDDKIIIRMNWLDKSYVPRRRSFPPFLKLYEEEER